jgi:hypothetical protein
VQQLAERAIHLLAEVDYDVAHAAGCAGAQRRSRVVGREAAVLELAEDAGCDERAKDASQLRRARADRVCDGLGSQRLRAEHVGHTQLRRDVQRLRDLIAPGDLHHCLLCGFHRAILCSACPGASSVPSRLARLRAELPLIASDVALALPGRECAPYPD